MTDGLWSYCNRIPRLAFGGRFANLRGVFREQTPMIFRFVFDFVFASDLQRRLAALLEQLLLIWEVILWALSLTLKKQTNRTKVM